MISFHQSQNKEILTQDETDLLHDIINGIKENDNDNKHKVTKYLEKLQRKGFKL